VKSGFTDGGRRTSRFQLLLFSTDPTFITAAVAAGVDGVVVDWERLGKEERQAGADTQIGADTVEDLQRVRVSTDALIVCRLNAIGPTTPEEIEAAIHGGADEILLSMVRTPDDVQTVLEHVKGRCRVGIMVETIGAIENVDALASLPISRAYAGLNDLAIERKSPNIFTAIADGTVERICAAFPVPVGFGGLTIVGKGSPIPGRLLVAEMMRVRCGFGVLRRSFHRDIRGRELAVEIPRLRSGLEEATRRAPEAIDEDRRSLLGAIERFEAVRA
jgi:hypothetical protein